MQLDLLDVGAILVSIGVLVMSIAFVVIIWSSALGAPLF